MVSMAPSPSRVTYALRAASHAYVACEPSRPVLVSVLPTPPSVPASTNGCIATLVDQLSPLSSLSAPWLL
jgi:hypothetical protein